MSAKNWLYILIASIKQNVLLTTMSMEALVIFFFNPCKLFLRLHREKEIPPNANALETDGVHVLKHITTEE